MMVTSKNLALVIAAIKELRETKGSTWREILRYISCVYNIPQEAARRQMQKALKRGVAYGILKKNGVYYSLPIDTRAECEEIATQELGLLDRYCRGKQRKKRRSRGCKPKKRRSRGCKSRKRRGARRSKRGMCKCKKRGRSSKRKRSRCKSRMSRRKSKKRKCICKEGGGRVMSRDRSMSPRSKIEQFSLKPTLETDKPTDCENSSNSSNPSIERRHSAIPLPY